MTVPPTRILSWQQLVQEADPDFQRARLQPWVYSFSNGRLFYAPVPLYNFVFDSGLILDGGFLVLESTVGWPTSTAGLQPGQMWSNGGFVSAIPGLTPQPGAPPLFLSAAVASQLLIAGAGNLPLTSPASGSTQLWLNGGFVCVA